jgi:hypothetical protein
VTLPQKFTIPEIAREGLTPSELEVLAWAEKLAAIANGLQNEVVELEQEVARLKKSSKRA